MKRTLEPVLNLLAKAGAPVPAEAVAAWSPEQVEAAARWALETIEAHATDPPGQHTSILWPAHVSRAYHGSAYGRHQPKPRGLR